MHRSDLLLWSLSLLLILSTTAQSKELSLRVASGKSDQNDLGEIISLQPSPHPSNTAVVGLEGGYWLGKKLFGLDLYLKGGLNKFLENGHGDDFYEATLYIKLYYSFKMVRIGFADGISYASNIPYVERLEAEKEGDNNSYALNYLEISLDLDIGELIGYNLFSETYVGYALKHRSGAYGLINGVKRGGSNYNLFYIEKNF